MAIQLNHLDVGGLTGLAGKSTPYLNLPVQGVQLGAGMEQYAKGLFEQAQMKQQAQIAQQTQAAETQRTAMNNASAQAIQKATAASGMALQQNQQQFQGPQNAMDRAQNLQIAQATNAVAQQNANQMGAYQQGELGIAQQGQNLDTLKNQQAAQQQIFQNKYMTSMLDMTKQKNAQDASIENLKLALTQTSDQRNARGGLAIAALQAANGVTDPNQLNQVLTPFIQQGVSQGIIKQDEANQLASMSPQQKLQAITADMYMSNKADELIKTNPSLAQSIANGGIGLTGKTKDKVQQALLAGQSQAKTLDDLQKSYDSEFTTVGGNIKAAIGNVFDRSPGLAAAASTLQGVSSTLGKIPVIGTALSAATNPQQSIDFEQKRENFYTSAKQQLINTLQGLSNIRPTPAVVKAITDTLPQKGDGDALSKAKFQAALDQASQLVQLNVHMAGYSGLDPKQIEDQVNQTLASYKTGNAAPSVSQPQPKTYTYKGKTLTDQHIDQIVKDNPGKTRDDVIKFLSNQNGQ